MNRPRKEAKAKTITVSTRLPPSLARRLSVSAAARQQKPGEYLRDLVAGHAEEATRPALAALAELLAVTEAARRTGRCDAAILADLRRLVFALVALAREEFSRDR